MTIDERKKYMKEKEILIKEFRQVLYGMKKNKEHKKDKNYVYPDDVLKELHNRIYDKKEISSKIVLIDKDTGIEYNENIPISIEIKK
jgi:hypothetical protein